MAHRIAFIGMESTLHDDDILATELTEDQVARVALNSALWELLNLAVLDDSLISNGISQGTQSWSTDDGNLGWAIDSAFEEIDNSLSSFVGSHVSVALKEESNVEYLSDQWAPSSTYPQVV